MTTTCPDNSTECLLRAILDADSGYNWNPATFGFTVVFTVIAFVVSVAALFQSFVAAGPGRLKASERAIGKLQHHQRANTRFSWEELRYRTLVNVPVIDINKILGYKSTVIEINRNELAPTPPSRVVAGWSQVLNDLGLTDVDFNTIECLTDYLPDDVPAALAWARVETIVLLAIMKGCSRLAEEDGFITATGYSAQLAWNMHPSLGPIAVYRTWDIKETPVHALQDVQQMVPIFLGVLYLADKKLFKPLVRRQNDIPIHFDFSVFQSFSTRSWARCRHKHDHCMARRRGLWAGYLANKSREGGVDKRTAILAASLVADRPLTTKAFPVKISHMHAALKTMYEEYFPWLILADDMDDNVLKTLCGSAFTEFDAREAMPDNTPCCNSKLTSWLPAASKQNSRKLKEEYVLERPALYSSDSTPGWGQNYRLMPLQPTTSDKILGSGLRIARPAVQHVSKWLVNEDYFNSATDKELTAMRQWLSYQLAEIDWFLSSMGDDAICAASNLIALGTIKFGVVQFTKLSRRFVMPETLNAFNLSWTVKPEDAGSIIVRGYLAPETIQRLFAYSRAYIQRHRKELHTVRCSTAAQGYYYTKKKSKSDPLPTDNADSLPVTSIEALLQTRRRSTDSTALKDIVEAETQSQTRRSSIDSDIRPDLTFSPSSVTKDSPSGTQIDPPPLPDLDPDPTDPVGDEYLRDWLEKDKNSRVGSGDEVAVHVDERIAALEAMAFFRAALFGAYLATGTDTSLVLISDKRYQLVQVQ